MILKILTPSSIAFEGEVDSVVAPASNGLLGILNNHAPLMASLIVGIVKYKVGDQQKEIAIENGFLEVNDNTIIILTDGVSKET